MKRALEPAFKVATATNRRRIPSFGFSGAGFMTCYHFGAAECLQKYGLLPKPGEYRAEKGDCDVPYVTGVSGGAIVASAVAVGIPPEEGMRDTLEASRRTKFVGGMLDGLRPGYSLIDEVEELILEAVQEVDQDLFFRRIDGGRKLRIGLTDRRYFPSLKYNPHAYVYADGYRDMNDVIAACILSSYVPGVTGPAWGALHSKHHQNLAVRRANRRLLEMTELGFVKRGSTGEPVILQRIYKSEKEDEGEEREVFWDGGIVEMFPVFDHSTCIISPLSGTFGDNPSICPINSSVRIPSLSFSSRARVHASFNNVETLRRITFSSDDEYLEQRFHLGFNDARRFLLQNGYISPKEMKATTTSRGNIERVTVQPQLKQPLVATLDWKEEPTSQTAHSSSV